MTDDTHRGKPKIEVAIMKIVVIGGSGMIGSKLVTKLREHGHEAVAASPNSGDHYDFHDCHLYFRFTSVRVVCQANEYGFLKSWQVRLPGKCRALTN